MNAIPGIRRTWGAALAWALSGQSRTRALMKDVLFLVASFYLLKQDLTRAALQIAQSSVPVWRFMKIGGPEILPMMNAPAQPGTNP